MADKKEVMIAMDPDMAAKFQASTHVSRKYIIFRHFLLLHSSFRHEGHLCQHAEDL